MDRVGLIARLLDVPAEGAVFADLQGGFGCDPHQRAFTRAVSVPLRIRDEAYGALVVYATSERPPFESSTRSRSLNAW